MTTITAAQLEREGACREWVDVMEQTFPKGMKLTLKNFNKLIKKVCEIGEYDEEIAFSDIFYSGAAHRVLGETLSQTIYRSAKGGDNRYANVAKAIRSALRKRDARRAKRA